MPTIDDLRKSRKDKLDALKKLGIDPYPSVTIKKHAVNEALKLEKKQVAIAGRIMAIRGHGKIYFIDVSDETGKIQSVFKSDVCKASSFAFIPYLDIGDFVAVQGLKDKTQAGEDSVFAEDFQILTKTLLPLPDKWHGLKDIEERYRKRYLDTLLNPEVKARMLKRSQIIDSIRDFLTDREFIEVETPTLQPVYGGGLAHPFVTHHNELDADLYLRISDEMYLKRLIVGGFEKVFEITKVFRNEGIDHDHNPEFTMFEAQIAFQDYRYGMDIIEEIIEYTAKRVLGSTSFEYQGVKMDVKRPWVKYRMTEAVKKFTGVDPLSWKTVKEAKNQIQKIDGISEDTFANLGKMQSIGECIAFVFEECVESKLIQPTIIYDYPVETSPLAKKCEDPHFTQRFEMFAFGSELGNNYSELNDPIDLKKRFVEEKKREEAGFDEAHQTDNDYLEAIEHGFPPTCGIAIGIDRFVMLLTDARSIKEVILFPTLRPEGSSGKSQENTKGIQKKEELILKGNPKSPMDLGIDYGKAKKLLEEYIKDPVTRMHCIESGAIMRAIARHFGESEEQWGTIGLLHDIDWELTKTNPTLHCMKTAEILRENGGTDYLIETIQSHGYPQGLEGEFHGPPEFKGKMRKSKIEHALAAAETMTGIIIAATLVQPDKKLSSVKPESLMKKFKAKSFAANCRREIIMECEEIGIPLAEFLTMGLKALQGVHEELGF